MKEIFRNIDDTKYSVSSEGRFFKNGKEKKGCINKGGYVIVSLCGKPHYLHRLIAQAFIPNPENKRCIDHLNTNRLDNRVENLRWVSHKENSNNPLTKKHFSDARKGKPLTEETKKKMSEAKRVITDETRKKLSEARKGRIINPFLSKHHTEEAKKKISDAQQKKPIYQFTKSGEFIKEWESAYQVQRALGYNQSLICQCCKNKLKFGYGFIWKYKEIA